MAEDKSTAESLRSTRTYGQVRCMNPSCTARITPAPGQTKGKMPDVRFRVEDLLDKARFSAGKRSCLGDKREAGTRTVVQANRKEGGKVICR